MRLTIKRSQRRTKVTITFMSERSTESILSDLEWNNSLYIPQDSITGVRIQETAFTTAERQPLGPALSVDSLETTRDRA